MTTTSEARIEVSTLCNYKCTFCPYSTDFNRKKEIMSNELFDTVLNEIIKIKNINVITLSGMGEILIDKDIIYKIKKAKDLGYRVNILTNGSLLTKDIVDKFISIKLDSIRLSLHTIDSEECKSITGANKDIYEHVLEIVEYIIENKSSMQFIISCDIIDINKNGVQLIIDKYEKRVDLLEIWKPHNWSSWKEYRKGSQKKKTCGRPFNGPLQVQVDGTMNMCCFDYNGELTIGDLKAQTIDEIFNAQEYKYIKVRHETGNMEGLYCNGCDQLYKADPGIVIYNSKFNSNERIRRTSTAYENMDMDRT